MRAWEEFLAEMEKELGSVVVSKWLRPLKITKFDACNLYLEASDSFKAVWFEEHIRPRLKGRLISNNHKPIKIHLSVAQGNKKEEKKEQKPPPAPTLPAFHLAFDEISSKFRFDNFVAGEGNILAMKILVEAVESSSPPFNPIYLFGRSGTGKTHLMLAAAHFLKERGKKVLYVRADTFTEHVVGAIRCGEMQLFRKHYRNVDALFIDDIEIFSRKGATQEELFHTFNTLHTEGKPLILASHLPPHELKFIEPRLVSRFEWGIVVPLQTLTRSEMKVVLEKKAAAAQFSLENDVIEYLLTTFSSSTKNLTRALEALMLRSHLSSAKFPLSLTYVKQTLNDLSLEEEKAVLTPSKIIRTVAEYYGIRSDDILSKSQNRECVLPRQIAMHLCRAELGMPYMKIGDIFARDHSTVMSSVKLIEQGLGAKNNEILSSLSSILKRLDVV